MPLTPFGRQALPSEGGSTVQVDDLTGYEAATLGRQPGGGETDLFWLSQPANRDSGKHPIELFTREVSNIGHQAQSKGVRRDPVLAVLNCDVSDQ